MNDRWDCIIVGGGAAGLSAALSLGRARRRTLVVDADEKSNRVAEGIGGLLGHDGRPPEELYRAGRDELADYPSVERRSGRITKGINHEDHFELELDDGSRELARKVLLATGMDYRPPDIPGFAARWGRSVFHCPFCHAWELRDRPLGVLDRGPAAGARALLLRFWSDDVTLFTNGSEEVSSGDLDRLEDARVVVDERIVSELRGPDHSLEAVAFSDGSYRACEGLLVPAPMRQRSTLATQLGARIADPDSPMTEALQIDPMYGTSVPGLFAAGDVGTHAPPSVATAIAAGDTAAKAIVRELVTETYPPVGVKTEETSA
jgi:thioredoxin reductase